MPLPVNPLSIPRIAKFAVPILLAVSAALMGYGAYVHSPTLNEPGHLVAGIENWKFGSYEIYKVNPPLVRMVAALPVLLSGAKVDWNSYDDRPHMRSEFPVGEDFVRVNGERSFWVFTLARWACIPFGSLGGYICFRWARELFGTVAGLLALTLWCFCPNLLANGQLITSDVPATSLGLCAVYSFWHWLKKPTWKLAALSGLVLGIAELAKMTLIVLLPACLMIWLFYRWCCWLAMTWRQRLRDVGMIAVEFLLALYVLNMGYGFQGTFTRLREFHFASTALGGNVRDQNGTGNRFAKSWVGSLPVPLPKNYLLGLDLQKKDLEDYSDPSYLRGQFSNTGWWYYYLYALSIKVPLGTWILIGLATMVPFLTKAKTVSREDFILLCPAFSVLVLVSSQTGFSEHMRYVLPAFPFVFVWTGRLASSLGRQHWIVTCTAIISVTWSVTSSLWIYPHNLSYFNELAGGPIGGPNHLIHSNLDWGQDLLFLRRWLERNPEVGTIKLAYFGYFDPIYAGIQYREPEDIPSKAEIESGHKRIPPGWYAISANFVRGLPYATYKGDGSKVDLRQYALTGFQLFEPIKMAGYSIYIYHITDDSSASQRSP